MLLAICKAFIILFALFWLYWTYRAVLLGFKERERAKRLKAHWEPSEHRRAAIIAYCFLWGIVLSVGIGHFVAGPHAPGGAVLAIHLPSAILLLVVLTVMTLTRKGARDQRTHRLLVPSVFVLSPIVLVTGGILVARL